MDDFWTAWKTKGEQTKSIPQMCRIWGKNLALEPNPSPQKEEKKYYTNLIDPKLKEY